MSEKPIFFHIVTRSKLILGQKMVFKDGYKNNLYRFFFEREVTNSKEEDFISILNNNYIQSEIKLNAEDTAVGLTYMDHTLRAIRETIVEMVRLEKYPEYPSRLSCLYTTKTYNDALKWKKLFESYNREVLQIVKVSVDGTFFEGDGDLLPNIDCSSFNKKINQAEIYWQGNKNNHLSEILVNGEIEVIEIIDNFI